LNLTLGAPTDSVQAAWAQLKFEASLGVSEAGVSEEQTPAQAQKLPRLGVVSAMAGEMAATSVVAATQLQLEGMFKAIVTAPLHKESLQLAGWSFPGHTELLQAHAAWHMGLAVKDLPVRMMLASDALRVVLVSIHISLKEAIERVDFVGVLETVRIAHQTLGLILGRKPKMALAGLNPHAGENGLMGQEEIEVLEPVVQKAQKLGIDVSGPIAPDTVFMRARRGEGCAGEFDAVIAMYHDQGLIPIKYMGLDAGVNVTLGLPLLRTSPDHGTAFDLAGTGQAREHSMVQAIKFAQKMSPNWA
jgi:4-hydroxythreonine-4-phosphate dehydrogenase